MSTYETTYCNTTTDLLFIEPYLGQYDHKRVLPSNWTAASSSLYYLYDSGYVSQLYKDGAEMTSVSDVANADNEFLYNSAADLLSYYLASTSSRYVGLVFIGILLPFWTPILVRIVAWIVTLGGNGVINQLLMYLGIVTTKNKPQMMYNQIGTLMTMIHVLLPLMILSLYAIMKNISKKLLQAGSSLGATGLINFWKIYLPLTMPGVGAGCTLVFIISLGYYITPAIVGGSQGTFISNFIEYHISSSLNWGLAASLSCILLLATFIFYWIYNQLIGLRLD